MVFWKFVNDGLSAAPKEVKVTISKAEGKFDNTNAKIWAFGNKGKIEFFPQTIKAPQSTSDKEKPYFISHSAMREWEWKALDTQKVFPDIYKESYKNQIMDRWIKANSNFGRYKRQRSRDGTRHGDEQTRSGSKHRV